MRTQFSKIALAATIALAMTFTLSCSSGGDGDSTCGGKPYDTGKYGCVNNELVGTCGGRYYNPENERCLNGEIQNGAEITLPSSSGSGGGGGDGAVIPKTSAIKDITGDSFTMVHKHYDCQENGTLEEDTYEQTISYTISGSTLSFGGAQFSGNSSSLIGTWIASTLQDIGMSSDVKKVVFTQNTLAITQCAGEPGEEREYRNGSTIKVIDCNTAEITKGNETVKVRDLGTTGTATYKGKTCKYVDVYSESQEQKACSDAYNKVMRENPGYDGSGDEVHRYYRDIRNDGFSNCIKDFPEWFN
jgi:hypothetical protein